MRFQRLLFSGHKFFCSTEKWRRHGPPGPPVVWALLYKPKLVNGGHKKVWGAGKIQDFLVSPRLLSTREYSLFTFVQKLWEGKTFPSRVLTLSSHNPLVRYCRRFFQLWGEVSFNSFDLRLRRKEGSSRVVSDGHTSVFSWIYRFTNTTSIVYETFSVLTDGVIPQSAVNRVTHKVVPWHYI